MPYVVKTGARTIGIAKKKKNVNSILAKQYRKDNRVSVLTIAGRKKKRRK